MTRRKVPENQLGFLLPDGKLNIGESNGNVATLGADGFNLVPVVRYLEPPSSDDDTSRDAAESMRVDAQTIRLQVLAAIRAKGVDGLTCDEAQVELALSHQTCSPRFWELHKKLGLIVDTGIRRKTRAGRNAVAWVCAKLAHDLELVFFEGKPIKR